MKSFFEVVSLLKITEKQLRNLIDPNRSHRKILDTLGCYKEGNVYLFSEEGIKYVAYQYMNKIDECLYYVFPEKKPTTRPADVHEPIEKKVIKNVKVIKKSN